MDEIFGEVAFAQEDLARKQTIENDIGLTALLNGEEHVAKEHIPGMEGKFGEKSDSDRASDELVEKTG